MIYNHESPIGYARNILAPIMGTIMTGRSVNINPKKQIFVKRTGEELGRAGFVFSGNMFQNEHMFFGSNSVFITSFFRSTEKMKIISNPRQSAQSVAKSYKSVCSWYLGGGAFAD